MSVLNKDFTDTIFSSVTFELLGDTYDSKALKEQLFEKNPPGGCVENFFCSFNFLFKFLILPLAADRLELFCK